MYFITDYNTNQGLEFVLVVLTILILFARISIQHVISKIYSITFILNE